MLLSYTGGDDRDGSFGAVRVVTDTHSGRVAKRYRVVEVHRLALGALSIDVDQHDLGGKSTQKQRVGERRADVTCADDDHTHGARTHVVSLF